MTAASVRRPAVAGLFYPDRPAEMEDELRRLIVEAGPGRDARALVVPHAGWQYSGRVAGEVYGRVRVPRLAVVLGPNHAGVGPGARSWFGAGGGCPAET